MNKSIIILVVVLIIGLIGFQISAYTNVETFTVKVEGKERITEKSGDNIESFYLVYTDKGTFKLEDDILRGNFYSSDVYGKLRQDSTYTFKTAGYRIGYMSSYPNIIEVKY
tara:strand:- start:159 stop:491 length:333 start_codon:yes stop_codon:yes gene_type:complete